MTRRRLQVLRPGLLTTVQDAGRPGHAHIGVPPSGALDRPAYELANRLVGNRAGAAGLETTMDGPTLVLHSTRVHHIALTGAPAPLWVDGRPVALYAPVSVLPGQQIEIGRASSGLRSYLGVSGGLHGEQVLGSLSTDVLSGLGPPVLAAGSSIELGWPGAVAPVDVVPVRQPADRAVLAIMTGPRLDWFTDDALAVLTSGRWVVSSDSNRVGVRLSGPALTRSIAAELPSEAVLTGSVQVPPDGQPLIFLNDHPVTGGYPVLAVLTDQALALAAQLRPGAEVGFSVR